VDSFERLGEYSADAEQLGAFGQIIRLRKQLSKRGLDAGAETIAAQLATAGI
jgi:hypothetical protein